MKGKVAKKRLDDLLFERGLVGSEREARALILTQKVVVDETVVTKGGTLVGVDAPIHIRGQKLRFVSRGGYKLEKALDRFSIDVEGMHVLDAGASTGGFTDCLIQRGAARVYAVDVGYGQIHSRLVHDERVVVFERTNIGELSADHFERPPDLCTADLAYLSLTKAVPILERLLAEAADLVCLVKPLYEGLEQQHYDDPNALERVLERLLPELSSVTARRIGGLVASPIHGGRGAIEFLIWLRSTSEEPPEFEALLKGAIADIQTVREIG